jgi:hypothetical protein
MTAFAGMVVPCSGRDLQQITDSVARGSCDACIMAGVEVAKARGLDPDVYAGSLGVTLSELLRFHPGWNLR